MIHLPLKVNHRCTTAKSIYGITCCRAVYEISFFFAAIVASKVHLQATRHAVPKLYASLKYLSSSENTLKSTFAIILILQSITETVTLGANVHTRQREMKAFCQMSIHVDDWIDDLTLNTIRHNYTQTMSLTNAAQAETVSRYLEFNPGNMLHDLARHAFLITLKEIRRSVRLQVWSIMRAAYRQVTLHIDDWCRLSLGFDDEGALKGWMEERADLGEAVAKTDSRSIWSLRKPK